MQTVKSREQETAQEPELPPEDKPAVTPELAKRYNPGRAALLSLIPGLGHFYVGQPVVGSLVLVSNILGLTFLTTVIAGKKLFPVVAPLAESVGIHLDTAAGAPQIAASPLSVGLYIVAILYLGAYFAADAYQQAARKSSTPAGFKPELGVTFTGSTSFSYLMHCVLLVICAIVSLFIIKVPVKTDTVIEIELEPPPIVLPPPPKAAPRPKAETPKVEKEPVKQVVPPKPVPIAVKPVEQPVNDTPSPQPVTQPQPDPGPASTGTASQGTATGSGSGDTGTGAGASDEVDLTDYVAAMEKKIRKSWFPPKGEETKKIVLKFKISAQGAVSSVRLKASSGIMMADDAAITAVKTAAPFAPLPKGAPDPTDILFTFDYSVFNGK